MAEIPTFNGKPMWDSNWLHAVDLQGKDVVVTIENIERGEVWNGKKITQEWVFSFIGKQKTFIANKTNLRTIASLYGDGKGWVGKRITLYPTKCKDKRHGKLVDCIRIREQKPGGAATTDSHPPTDDEKIPY
jgi:hypothetical protein